MDSPGKNTGGGCRFLLQGVFPPQELSPGLQYYRQILYQLSYEGSPANLYREVQTGGVNTPVCAPTGRKGVKIGPDSWKFKF